MADTSQRTGQPFTFAEPLTAPMVMLLVAFAAVFVLQMISRTLDAFAMEYLALDTAAFIARGRLWQAFTSIFLHGGVCHFLWNMVFFWFLGSGIANAWRRREFLGYLLICGLAASMSFYVFNSLVSPEAGVKGIGASGVVFGLMIAYAMVLGERTILAFFLIPMKAKYFIAILFAIEVLLLVRGIEDGVAHIAHIGGAVAGAITIKLAWRKQSAQASSRAAREKVVGRIAGLEFMDEDPPEDGGGK